MTILLELGRFSQHFSPLPFLESVTLSHVFYGLFGHILNSLKNFRLKKNDVYKYERENQLFLVCKNCPHPEKRENLAYYASLCEGTKGDKNQIFRTSVILRNPFFAHHFITLMFGCH